MDPCAARLVLRVLSRLRRDLRPVAAAPTARPPVIPEVMKRALRERLAVHAARRGLGQVEVRFRRGCAYVDAASAGERPARPLVRLRWTGEPSRWELARLQGRTWVRDAGPHGDFHAAPEEGLEAFARGA